MHDPEATQRNWLVGSQVVVAAGGEVHTASLSNESVFFFFFVFPFQEQHLQKRRGRLLTALLLVAHVPAVVVPVALPDAADAAAVGAAVLVGQTAVH